jgi:hypothetical protein
MKRSLTVLALVLLLAGSAIAGNPGFLEQFSLAKDRSVPLKELIPGTKDYYYYNCLHLQNTGRLDAVDTLLVPWIKKYGYTSRVTQMRNRQALLRYGKDPKKALAYIRQALSLNFTHQKEELNKKPQHPTRLDQNLFSRQTLTQRARSRYQNLRGFEDSAFDFLFTLNLNDLERRDLLRRIRRPDYPNLPKMVVDDLNYKYKATFGSYKVHRALLKAQLNELLTLQPNLLNQTHFVNAYLTKLHPNADVDWKHDAKARQAYLEALWSFAKRLAPAHNSLKAHVLYHRLLHDRSQGVFDKDRFMEYVRLPRRVNYVSPGVARSDAYRRYGARLSANYNTVTLLPPVRNDEPLVRSYLQHFFVKEASYKPYMTWIRDDYLKPVFAETKIVNGVGDQAKWFELISPGQLQALKERVDLDFAPTNKTTFAADERVSLTLDVKNVKTMIVKVYEINAFNYYRDKKREVDTDMNLDGLVANEEKVHKYGEIALRRVKRTFDFPALTKRGVYVVEFIGNGKSSRALVRKGRLRYIERLSAAGHLFTVLNDANRQVKEATLWLSGHEYKPDEDGVIAVPYSNRPGSQPIILKAGSFCSLDTFSHSAEAYYLSAGIYVDREALLKRQTATVIVRPQLLLNGVPVSLKALEKPELQIASVDRDGVSTTKEVKDFKLQVDSESTYDFKVPENLSRITFTLKARIRNLSRAKDVNLSTRASFSLNGIDRTEKIEDLHLCHVGGEYVAELLGKSGEVKADRPVLLDIKHRDFRNTVHVVLQTDAQGRVPLGALKDVQWVRARGPEGTTHTWRPLTDKHTYPSAIHGRAGESLYVPYMGKQTEPTGSAFSLLERVGKTFLKDRRSALSVKAGFVIIKDLPAGDYDLWLKESNTHVLIRLTDGRELDGYVLSKTRMLQTRHTRPLQIAGVDTDADTVTVRLLNSSKFARVHVFATRFMPAYPLYGSLGRVHVPESESITRAVQECVYLSGRDIGDEYRYILERKYARKFPGNMLKRPSLLLNPWAVRKTETGYKVARDGRAWGKGGKPERRRGSPRAKRPPTRPGIRADEFGSVDFLAEPAVVMANLKPDKDGVVTIKLKDLGPHQQVRVMAVDPETTAYREIALPKLVTQFKDLRLIAGLDPKKHYTEQKQITALAPGKSLVIKDFTTSRIEAYDSLAKTYGLLYTLSRNSTLREFSFILNWPKLKPEEKREKYSKYACHELSFFLYQKDPDFLKAVILPYLKNKRDKTFMDHWLIGADLSAYLKPWAFARLNIVERALLARSVKAERAKIDRHVRELWEMIPPNIERYNYLFKTALKGSALEIGGANGRLAELQNRAEREELTKGDALDDMKRPSEGAYAPKPADMPAKTETMARKMAKELKSAEKDKSGYYDFAAGKRAKMRQYYRKLDKTQEWAENNYYHLPITAQNGNLVRVNTFWRDYAATDKAAMLSTALAETSSNFTEMMFALSALDLPFEAKEHQTALDGRTLTLKAASAMIAFHKEIKEAKKAAQKVPILVSQNFYRHGDRYRHVGNERVDKYVADEFVVHTVYGCQVVVTNPTSSRQKLDVLLQIPRGALPVRNGFYTRSVHMDLQPYATRTFDYYFYFPAAGEQPHYPVHVAKNEEMIAAAEAVTLKVVKKPTKIDKTSWAYISQHGTDDEALAFLKTNNINRADLSRIAFRMRNKAMFDRTIALLQTRHTYNHTLYSYGIYQGRTAGAGEYLQHSSFANQCGTYIQSQLLTIDPVLRRTYQHLEYSPLVNARAHKLGKMRTILNNRFSQQYSRLLTVLSYKTKLGDDDLMAVTYYMLLQDRIEDAMKFFARVDPGKLATQLQHDYFKAYLDFFTDDHRVARRVATKYKGYPVDRWRKVFADVLAQLDEIEGKGPKVVDKDDRTQAQTRLAATAPSFDFSVEARKVNLNYQNLTRCTVSYYLMDIELLFSRNPFVQRYANQFSYIRPNRTETVRLPEGKTSLTFDLPKQYHSSNVMVEVSAGGVKKSQAYYAHSLALQVIENYGQVRVADKKTGKALPKVYVKVYARMKNGPVKFYKDGYTDLRGRFDYTSLNTNELDNVGRFSILIMSEKDGAVIREAAPPKR